MKPPKIVESKWRALDEPHMRIHAIGREINEALRVGNFERASALLRDVHRLRDELVGMLREVKATVEGAIRS